MASELPTAVFASRLQKGELVYQATPDGESVFPPRVVAPRNLSGPLEWRVSAGLGRVYAVTGIPEENGGRVIALVDLDEGFRMMTEIVGARSAADVSIGQRVRVDSLRSETGLLPVPLFRIERAG